MFRLALLVLVCACGGKVSPDETTAEGHLREAEKERAAAREALERHEAAARTPEGGSTQMASRGTFSASGEWAYDATSDGRAATITTGSSGDVAELRRRARRQIVVGKPPTPL